MFTAFQRKSIDYISFNGVELPMAYMNTQTATNKASELNSAYNSTSNARASVVWVDEQPDHGEGHFLKIGEKITSLFFGDRGHGKRWGEEVAEVINNNSN